MHLRHRAQRMEKTRHYGSGRGFYLSLASSNKLMADTGKEWQSPVLDYGELLPFAYILFKNRDSVRILLEVTEFG